MYRRCVDKNIYWGSKLMVIGKTVETILSTGVKHYAKNE